MENKNIETLEDIQSQRMYLQLQELKILLRNARDAVTGKTSLDSTLKKQVMDILKSLLESPKYFIDACVVLHNEKPGYIYYNKDINKFRGFFKDEANEDEKCSWRTVEVMEDNDWVVNKKCL